MNANNVLITALLTEKANLLSAEYGQYAFEVNPAATKFAIGRRSNRPSRSRSRACRQALRAAGRP